MLLDSHDITSVHLLENAISSEMLNNQRVVEVLPDKYGNILWAASLDERESLDILLSALSLAPNPNWNLYVVGGGPLSAKCNRLAVRYNIDRKISWVGKVSRYEVGQYYARSDLHAITSLAEGNPSTI